MSLEIREAHVERLLGAKVHDVNGEMIGRLEEMIVEIIDGEAIVTEFHIGPEAMLERIGGFLGDMPYFHLLPFPKWAYRIGWQTMDLREPSKPRVKVAKASLRRVSAPG
jgi:sporulation protein YlmC with PRC-barrel domain